VFDGLTLCLVMNRKPARTGRTPRRIRSVIRFVRSMHHGLLFLILTGAVAAGQDRPIFSAESELVVLHVNVKDRNGAYLTGLTKEAFAVLEDGHPQMIRFFANEDQPVTLGLLIDSSGSMQPNRNRVIAAATAFAEASNPDDEMFALAFNENVKAALPPTAPFTSDATVLRDAITRTVHARGRTGLFDAISRGLDYVAQGSHERKVLVVVSDGGDNASHTTFEETIARTQASNAVIHTVALVDPDERDANPKLLKRLAQASGGEPFAPHDAREITDVLRRIARDIRHTYTIGYVPTDSARDRAFRRILVTVASPHRRRLAIRTRSGYLAAPSSPRIDGDVR
jgi:Ca-activated chloride channel homolog